MPKSRSRWRVSGADILVSHIMMGSAAIGRSRPIPSIGPPMASPLFVTWRIGLPVVIITALVLSGDFTSAQQNKRRKNDNKRDAAKAAEARELAAVRAANAQIGAAKKVLAAAESKEEGAQARLKAALAGLRSASKEFDEAQDTVRHLAKELAEIETEILAEQGADSPYAKAAAAVADAKGQLKTIEDRLLAAKVPQQSIPEHAEYVEAKARLDAAATAAETTRRELFRGDSSWRAAAEALTKARQEKTGAAGETNEGSVKRKDAEEDLEQAKDAIASARAAIRKAEAVIDRAKANDKNKPRPGNESQGKKKPKN
jgi:chromosome segregation ATPase